MKEGTKPEFEIYDAGMLNNLAHLIDRGHVKKPVYLQFVLGILGGMQATVNNLVFLLNSTREIIGDEFVWSVCAAGRLFNMTPVDQVRQIVEHAGIIDFEFRFGSFFTEKTGEFT